MTTNLAGLFVLLALATALFQIALILGAPLGHMTQGRTERGPLPRAARISAAVSIVLLLFMSAAMLSAAGRWPGWPIWTGWLTVAMAGIATLLNAITPSQAEKQLWLPVSGVMFVAALGVMVF